MRLEGVTAPQVDTTGGSERTNIEKALRMSEGDVIHARVLSVGDGTASLRTSDGALLCARLENGVMLSPGADVYLSVKDSGSEITVLSPVNPELAMTGVRRADPLLEAVFNQLVSLGYEPTAENMSAVRQLLAEIPDMPLREAAFFAAQGLDPEPALLDAFRAVASGEADTASFLDKLSVAVSAPAESAVPVASSAARLNRIIAPAAQAIAMTPSMIMELKKIQRPCFSCSMVRLTSAVWEPWKPDRMPQATVMKKTGTKGIFR